MKKMLAALLLSLSFAPVVRAQEAWDRYHEVCAQDGPAGALCNGLVGYFRLDQVADSNRDSLTNGSLSECHGTDVATSTTARFGLARSAAFDGSGSKGLMFPGGGGFGGGTWTVAVWVYPTSATVTSPILSTMDTGLGKQGLQLDLYYTGSALNARARSYMQDTDTILTAQNTTNVTANAWHLIVFQSGHSTVRKLYSTQALKVSVDNGAFTSSSWTNQPRMNVGGSMVIGKSDAGMDPITAACSKVGAGFTGHMQSLHLYGRILTASDLALLWNGGAGRDFPFAR